MPWRRARRCSVFKRRDLDRVGLGDLGAGLAQPESQVAKDALALAYPQPHLVAQVKIRREQLAVTKMTGMTKLLRVASQVLPQRRPLFRVQRGGPTRTYPTHRPVSPWVSKRVTQRCTVRRSAPNKSATCWQLWSPVTNSSPCNRWSYRDLSERDFLLDGQSHHVDIGNDQFTHDRTSSVVTYHQCA